MNELLGSFLVALASAPCGALIAIWLDRKRQSRREKKRLNEFMHAPDGAWQSWRDGLYDIRDWASDIAGYLRSRDPRALDFSMIRVPGSRLLDHMIRSGHVPREHVQQALVLQGYCDVLDAAVAKVFAHDLDRPPASPYADEVLNAWKGGAPKPVKPALIQLADAVRKLAYELADPATAQLRDATRSQRPSAGRRTPPRSSTEATSHT